MLLRSSAVTLCTSAHTSFLAPAGGGLHTTCQSPCWALTVPPSGAWASAGAAARVSAATVAQIARRRPAKVLAKPPILRWMRTKLPNLYPGRPPWTNLARVERRSHCELAAHGMEAGLPSFDLTHESGRIAPRKGPIRG